MKSLQEYVIIGPELMAFSDACLRRVREEITLHFRESSRPHDKAPGGRIVSYLIDEQSSQAGWIGSRNGEVMFKRAFNIYKILICGKGDAAGRTGMVRCF